MPGLCFAFQRGECDRGSSCRFAHSEADVSEGGPKVSTCRPGGATRLSISWPLVRGSGLRGVEANALQWWGLDVGFSALRNLAVQS